MSYEKLTHRKPADAREIDLENEAFLSRQKPKKKNKKGSSSISSTKVTILLFLCITFFSLLSRLWKLADPPAVLFDEVHFVSFSQWYKARKYFFDIHPPLAKLILAGVAYLVDFHTDVPYREIETPFTHPGYYYMRLLQAIWGAMLPPMAFITLRDGIGVSLWASFFGSALVLLELSLQTISRAVLLDSFLYFTIALGFYSALKMWNWRPVDSLQERSPRKGNGKAQSPLPQSTFSFWLWTVICSFSIGFSLSIKHTGLVIVGLVGVIHIFFWLDDFFSTRPPSENQSFALDDIDDDKDEMGGEKRGKDKKRRKDDRSLFFNRYFVSGLLLLSVTIVIYFASFYVHFAIFKYKGVDEDSMPVAYQSTLIGNEHLANGEPTPTFFENFLSINYKMYEVNSMTSYEHYYTSQWYEWPFMYRGIMYYWKHLENGYHECIYLFGNPFIYWTGLLSVLLAVPFSDRMLHLYFSNHVTSPTTKQLFYNCVILLMGYLINLLPYMVLVKRPTYLYHYHPSLYFSILLSGVMIDLLLPATTNNSAFKARLKPLFVIGFLLFLTCSYFFFLPFSFGLKLNEAEHESRRIFKQYFPLW